MNRLNFLLIQVKTCMFYHISSENNINVLCELSGKYWHVFVLFIYCESIVQLSGNW